VEEILTDADRNAMLGEVRAVCNSYRQELEAQSGRLTPRAAALMDRLSLLAEVIVLSMLREFADSQFKAVATELDLREIGRSCTLPLENGHTLPLTGKVDRLDLWKAPDGKAYLHVVDYKTGTRTFSPSDVPNGFSLQMPLYLAALCNRAYPFLNKELGLPVNTVLTPAGVSYFSSAISTENTRCIYKEEAVLRRAADSLKRSALLLGTGDVLNATSRSGDPAVIGSGRNKAISLTDERGFELLFADLAKTISRLHCEMKEGLATARPNPNAKTSPCEYCRFAAICRIAKLHHDEKEVEEDA
jgi:ATP-dependent helicase/nuclease subunit B